MTKVKTAKQLLPAIEAVWPYDKEAVAEAFMPGREFSNGALRVNGEVVVLPVTEIIPETEFYLILPPNTKSEIGGSDASRFAAELERQ